MDQLEDEVCRAVEAVRRACPEGRWNVWADRWLSREDRTAVSAHRATRDARIGSGSLNAEDCAEQKEYVEQARGGLGFSAGFYLEVAAMQEVVDRTDATECFAADEEAERAKLTMRAAELASHAAELFSGNEDSPFLVAQTIGELASSHARTARRLAEAVALEFGEDLPLGLPRPESVSGRVVRTGS